MELTDVIKEKGYNKYQDKNPIQRLFLNNFINALQELLQSLPVELILEVGCGEGYMLREVLRCRSRISLFGMDINDNYIRQCRKINPTIPLVKADIARLPFKERSVDLLMCLEVLEHLTQPVEALLEIRRICSRYVILSVPNQPYFRIGNFIRGRYIKKLGNQSGHIHLWTAREFVHLVRRYFKIIKVVKPFPWIMLLCEVGVR